MLLQYYTVSLNHGQHLILIVFKTKRVTNQYVLDYFLSLAC